MSNVLKWKSGGFATYYQVWRNTIDDTGTATMIADDVEGTSYEDTTATAGVPYKYWLKSKNGLGTSGFSTPTVSFTGKLRPPTDVTATLTNEPNVTISWTAAAGATLYEVQRATVATFVGYSVAGTTSGTSFNDAAPSGDVVYFYRVVSKNGNAPLGNSDPSLAAIGYAALAAPATPTGLSATTTHATQITVSWSAAARAQVYDIYRTTSPTSDFASAVLIGTTVSLSYADSASIHNNGHYYWIKARNYTGASSESSSVFGTRLNIVSGLSISESGGVVTVTWLAKDGADGYKIFRNDLGSDPYAVLEGNSNVTFNDSFYNPDTNYTYYVAAYNTTGDGVQNSVSITTDSSGGSGGTPAAPGGVTASDDQANQITVGWNPVPGATTFSVWRNTTNDSSTATQVASSLTSLSWVDTTVALDTTYYYWVKATNSYGTSAFSTGNAGFAYHNFDGASRSTATGESIDLYYALNAGGTLDVYWRTYSVADQLQIYNNGTLIFDTGFVVYSAGTTFPTVFSAGIVRVVITTAFGSTEWDFSAT